MTIKYLTVQHFNASRDQGVVNHDFGANWTIQYNAITNNAGAAALVGSNGMLS